MWFPLDVTLPSRAQSDRNNRSVRTEISTQSWLLKHKRQKSCKPPNTRPLHQVVFVSMFVSCFTSKVVHQPRLCSSAFHIHTCLSLPQVRKTFWEGCVARPHISSTWPWQNRRAKKMQIITKPLLKWTRIKNCIHEYTKSKLIYSSLVALERDLQFWVLGKHSDK